jgi:hypothetical protein
MSLLAPERLMIPRLYLRSMLVAAALVGAMVSPALAQGDILTRIREASRGLASASPALSRLDGPERERVVEFVIGNALFTLGHELGHGVCWNFKRKIAPCQNKN